MRTLFAAFLDKEYPPQHSFVDGFLASALPRGGSVRPLLVTSRGIVESKLRRHGRAVAFNILPRRRGFGRIHMFFAVALMILKLRRKARRSQVGLDLWIRNDPIMLASAVCLKSAGMRVWYQTSFPHERGPGLKAFVARGLLRLCLPRVDCAIAVSDLGRARIRELRPTLPAIVIPLCPEEELLGLVRPPRKDAVMTVVYVGSHAEDRELAEVLAGCIAAIRAGANIKMEFIGGRPSEITALRADAAVREMEQCGALRFFGSMRREDVWSRLVNADIGLSLIPPAPKYAEASPTKLAEYLAAGLAVLASHGIQSQEVSLRDSAAGLLVPFTRSGIKCGVLRLCSDPDSLAVMQSNARRYAATVTYSTYVPLVAELIERERV